MKFTLAEIARHLKGKIIGNPNLSILGVSEIQNSHPNTITFFSNPIYKKYLSTTKATAIIVSNENLLDGKNGIVVSNPQLAMGETLKLFYPAKRKPHSGVHSTAILSDDVKIGKKITIEPRVIINEGSSIGDGSKIGSNSVVGENVVIGENCKIFPNVSIYDDSVIGNDVVIHSGTIIGCDGFGYVKYENVHKKIPQKGNVIIGDCVEIGSNCTIDRATIGSTVIGEMTKVDNLVHIAHNVKIGKGCILTAGFGIAGSTEVGDYCTFGGQVGVGPHLTIGNNTMVAAKSGVTKSLKGGKIYAGYPAREIEEHNKRLALINQISTLRKKVDQIIKKD